MGRTTSIIGGILAVGMVLATSIMFWQCGQRLDKIQNEILPCHQLARDEFCRVKGHKKAMTIPLIDSDTVFQCRTLDDRVSDPYIVDAVDTSRCPKTTD